MLLDAGLPVLVDRDSEPRGGVRIGVALLATVRDGRHS